MGDPIIIVELAGFLAQGPDLEKAVRGRVEADLDQGDKGDAFPRHFADRLPVVVHVAVVLGIGAADPVNPLDRLFAELDPTGFLELVAAVLAFIICGKGRVADVVDMIGRTGRA